MGGAFSTYGGPESAYRVCVGKSVGDNMYYVGMRGKVIS